MRGRKEVWIGFGILVILVLIIIGIKFFSTNGESIMESNLKTVYVATGGGKENFLADEEVNKIMKKKYGLNVIYDSWSNGKLIKNPLVREDGTKYDVMFCSDQRFYDYYKLAPDTTKGESARYTVQKGGLTLNTPIVIYSWDTVVDALIEQKIVTEKDGVYYITDMPKLISYILEGKKWKDIGVDMLYGSINIDSTDPVTSSPGATYYGLLLSIMCDGEITDEAVAENLPKLKEFYTKSGYMNNTPADLFELYLKTGVGGKPMIVDYEKSVIDFANSNPDGWEQVKDKMRILYPTPTIWNSHCIASFDEAGDEYYEAYEDKEIQQIAWSKYGFRTGVTGGNYDVTQVNVKGIPQSIISTVSSLKMNVYEQLISYLGNK
ncbi:MAG: hypothetical protein ACLUT6_04520 [Clostridia bacterium]|jgi:hypothetical protein|nr:hypothetical protein [Clostridium sp.]